MDLVSSCKVKLTYFRIKELKDVLSQLGLPKQGKKQDLVDRILDTLSDERDSGMWGKKNAVWKEEVAKLLDDTYRKMQISEASDLVSKGQSVPYSSNVKLEGEIEDSYQMDKIRCPCGSLSQTNSMIKCMDPRCHVWQHIGCVIIPDKPVEGVLPAPVEIFYCELCRLSRADPFLVTVADPLNPVKLTTANVPADGTNLVQTVEKTFQLTRADKDLLSKQEYDVQAWCMLLNDKVPFRMQWPQYADLQVNGIPVRVINRPGSQLLGANGRDDGPVITPCTRDGINRISLTGCDSRVFCLGVRIAKRRTIQQIFSLIPKESDGELFEDALARVRRCVGGGTATENADDSDSDLEIVADSIPVNLRCPMSGSRIKVAGRFKPCLHMGGFDLEVFVELNQRSRKWQCPICLRNYSLENVIIDPYFNRITSKMQNYGEDVTEIEVKPDGSWRAKTDTDRREVGDLGLWHRPDGTLCVPMVGEANPKSEAFKHIKQEGTSEGYTGLKLGIKKNQNGFWEVSKPEDVNALSSGYTFENHDQSAIPMGKSAKGSGKDDDDSTGTQDGGGNFDFSANSGIQLDSSSLNIDQTCAFTSHNSAPWGDAEVIVLSDSEEENDTNISSGTVYRNNEIDAGGVTFPVPPHGIPYSYGEDPGLGTGGSSCLDLFNANDHFEIPLWSLPPGSRAGPSFQLFGTDAVVSGSLADLQNGAINCPTSRNSYPLTAETAMASTALVPESSVDCPNVDIDDALIDIPFTFDGDDPSLQIFLPTRPSDALMQPNLRDPPNVSNSIRTEDWKSLRLGGDGTGGHGESVASENGLHSQPHLQNSKEGAMECSVDTDLVRQVGKDLIALSPFLADDVQLDDVHMLLSARTDLKTLDVGHPLATGVEEPLE